MLHPNFYRKYFSSNNLAVRWYANNKIALYDVNRAKNAKELKNALNEENIRFWSFVMQRGLKNGIETARKLSGNK